METLYAAGARKFIVWHVSAGDVVPLVNTMNNLLNLINTILVGLGQIEAKPNVLKAYTKGFVVRTVPLLMINVLKHAGWNAAPWSFSCGVALKHCSGTGTAGLVDAHNDPNVCTSNCYRSCSMYLPLLPMLRP